MEFFFANVVNGEKPVTAFPEKLHRRCLTEFYIHLWGYSYAAFFYPKWYSSADYS